MKAMSDYIIPSVWDVYRAIKPLVDQNEYGICYVKRNSWSELCFLDGIGMGRFDTSGMA